VGSQIAMTTDFIKSTTKNTLDKINDSGVAASIQAKYDLAQLDRIHQRLKYDYAKVTKEL
jgi:hypothetical protein